MPFCQSCGKRIKEDYNFCDVCGTKREKAGTISKKPVYKRGIFWIPFIGILIIIITVTMIKTVMYTPTQYNPIEQRQQIINVFIQDAFDYAKNCLILCGKSYYVDNICYENCYTSKINEMKQKRESLGIQKEETQSALENNAKYKQIVTCINGCSAEDGQQVISECAINCYN